MRTQSQVAYRCLHAAKSRAKKHGAKFDLTYEWVLERVKAGCALSGQQFDLEPGTKHKRNPNVATIDRISNDNRDYTMDNCRVITFLLNAGMSNHGWEELKRQVLLAVEKEKQNDTTK